MTEEKTSFFGYREKILADIKSRLSHLNNYGITIFIAACCQRQVSAYAKASMNQSWSHTDLIKKLIKSVLEYLLKDDGDPAKVLEIPNNLSEILSSALPEDPCGDIDNCAVMCVSSIEVLFEAINNPQIELAIIVSEDNLEILSTLLYSVLDVKITATSDIQVYSHKSIKSEINKQLDDISRLIEYFNHDTILEIHNNSAVGWAGAHEQPHMKR